MGVCTTHAVVGEAIRRHDLGIIQVPPVNHDGILEFPVEPVEIKIGELFPLGENQQCIGATGSLVG